MFPLLKELLLLLSQFPCPKDWWTIKILDNILNSAGRKRAQPVDFWASWNGVFYETPRCDGQNPTGCLFLWQSVLVKKKGRFLSKSTSILTQFSVLLIITKLQVSDFEQDVKLPPNAPGAAFLLFGHRFFLVCRSIWENILTYFCKFGTNKPLGGGNHGCGLPKAQPTGIFAHKEK